jgi:hypothetical protein
VEKNNEETEYQNDTEARVHTAILTEEHLAEMMPTVLEGLREAGYFTEDTKIGNSLSHIAFQRLLYSYVRIRTQ